MKSSNYFRYTTLSRVLAIKHMIQNNTIPLIILQTLNLIIWSFDKNHCPIHRETDLYDYAE